MNWRAVEGFPKYEVSDEGQVRNSRGHVLKGQFIPNGYHVVFLYRDDHCHPRYTHHLVAEHFIGERPESLQVNHKDGVKANNSVSNLEHCTGKENMRHAINNGLLNNAGENNPQAKLTQAEVDQIRVLLASGMSPKDVAAKYGVKRSTIYNINRGRTWASDSK